MSDSQTVGNEQNPSGTRYEAYCPNCDGATVHNSHFRCIECNRMNERFRSLHTESKP